MSVYLRGVGASVSPSIVTGIHVWIVRTGASWRLNSAVASPTATLSCFVAVGGLVGRRVELLEVGTLFVTPVGRSRSVADGVETLVRAFL